MLTSRAFWRYAPQSTLIIGGFMALQGLWAVPWLMNFSGLTRELAAHHLLLMAGGIVGGLAVHFPVVLAARVAEGLAAGVVQPIPAIIGVSSFSVQ